MTNDDNVVHNTVLCSMSILINNRNFLHLRNSSATLPRFHEIASERYHRFETSRFGLQPLWAS
jgi:hypothetical protein